MSSLHKKPFSLSSFKTLSYFIPPNNTQTAFYIMYIKVTATTKSTAQLGLNPKVLCVQQAS